MRIGTGIGTDLSKVSGPSLDPTTAAWVTATAMTDGTIINAANTYRLATKDLVSDANKIAAYLLATDKASNTDRLEQFKFNFYNAVNSDAAKRLTYSGTITATPQGMQGNGANGFANTFCNPSTDFSGTDCCLFFYSRTVSTASGTGDFGCLNSGGTGGIYSSVRTHAVSVFNINGNQNTITGVTNSGGFFLVKRVGNTVTLKRNNVVVGTYTSTTLIVNIVMYLMSVNINGTASVFSPKQYTHYEFWNVGTNDSQDTAIFNAVLAKEVALSRNVV